MAVMWVFQDEVTDTGSGEVPVPDSENHILGGSASNIVSLVGPGTSGVVNSQGPEMGVGLSKFGRKMGVVYQKWNPLIPEAGYAPAGD
jgi:hypothetical protein